MSMSGRLHVISDARHGGGAVGVVTAAIAAGAPVVQVRAQDCTDRVLDDFARRVVGLCASAGVTCTVNDRVDVAIAVGVAGSHLGAEDLPIAAVRQVAGPGHLAGGTARDAAGAAALVAEVADYLGVGPGHRTVTKAGLPAPAGTSSHRRSGQRSGRSGHRDRWSHDPARSRAGGDRRVRGSDGDRGLGRAGSSRSSANAPAVVGQAR